MSFIRPEAQAALARWWGLGLAILGVALGAYWVLTGRGLLPYIGGIVALGSAALAADQLRRSLFFGGQGGAGVVEVDERRITYLTGQGGAVLSLDRLARVEIEVLGAERRDWVFTDQSDEQLYVPLSAEGADALFDALAALPGMNTGEAIRASTAPGPDRFLIWQKDRRRLH